MSRLLLTIASFLVLLPMKELKVLTFADTPIWSTALQRLNQALPDTDIESDTRWAEE